MHCKRPLQIVLLLLVGVNLTLVCQGHVHDGRVEGPHIAVLPETDELSESNIPTQSTGEPHNLFSGGEQGRSTASAQNQSEGSSTSILPALLPTQLTDEGATADFPGGMLVLPAKLAAEAPDTPPPRDVLQ